MELSAAHNAFDIHLLQVDTEGYDAEIVAMIDFDRCRPLVIKYEHKGLGAERREQLECRLKQRGYQLAQEVSDTVAWL